MRKSGGDEGRKKVEIRAQMTALRGSGVREEVRDRPQRMLPHISAVTPDIVSSPGA